MQIKQKNIVRLINMHCAHVVVDIAIGKASPETDAFATAISTLLEVPGYYLHKMVMLAIQDESVKVSERGSTVLTYIQQYKKGRIVYENEETDKGTQER